MFAVIKMELSGKTVYGPMLKTTQQVDNYHPLPRYSVIAADTLRDLVTLTFDL